MKIIKLKVANQCIESTAPARENSPKSIVVNILKVSDIFGEIENPSLSAKTSKKPANAGFSFKMPRKI